MSFGDVIRSAPSPTGYPSGIGGTSNIIWYNAGDVDRVYELNEVDFSVIRYTSSPHDNPAGIGGDANTIWHCDLYIDRIYELNNSDLSVIRYTSSPGGSPRGIGGDANTIWHNDEATDRIYELNNSDLSVIRYTSSPSYSSRGIGGDASTIWHCDNYAHRIYELNNSDFSIIRATTPPTWYPTGIGGDTGTIWHCDFYANSKIYELDVGVPPTFTLSGTISDEFGNPIRDADITISNGTTYTTTTDENGAYSQVVDADTYDIAVSKSHSRFHDITESSVSVTADTTQDITMITDKNAGKHNTVKGMSIPGGIEL